VYADLVETICQRWRDVLLHVQDETNLVPPMRPFALVWSRGSAVADRRYKGASFRPVGIRRATLEYARSLTPEKPPPSFAA
jgi:hypothetical protein